MRHIQLFSFPIGRAYVQRFWIHFYVRIPAGRHYLLLFTDYSGNLQSQ